MGRIARLARRPWFWIASAIGLAGAIFLAFGYFGIHTAFIDERVDEPLKLESDAPVERVATGQFHAVAHDGTGRAEILRSADQMSLRLEDLDVHNGPDLYVYAVAVNDAHDSDTVGAAEILDLGKLKGNQGNQTYALPAQFDPAKHKAIVIWCKRFGVNFATAPLSLAVNS